MQKKFLILKRRSARLRHPYAVPFMTFAVLLVVSAIGYFLLSTHEAPARDSRVVIISHDNQEQTVPSIEPTVGALLQKLHLTLDSGDVVEPSLATPIRQDDFRINIYRAVPVEIIDGGQKKFTYSAATTPRAIANQTGASVYPEDGVATVPVDNFVTQGSIGEQVVINRSVPVGMNVYGTIKQVRTHAKTVADLIRSTGIKLAASDQVSPSLNTPITSGTQVLIARLGTRVETVTQPIAMPIQRIEDPTLAYGTSAVRQQGSPGQQLLSYQDNLVNGNVTGRTLIQTVITQQPVTEIVVQGTSLSGIKGDMALAGIASSDYDYVDYIVSHESGWCPTKAQGEHYCPTVPDNQFTSLGYGLCQATPGSKMSTAGGDWATNPITQLRWCSGYAHSRYGSWYAAYEHWLADHNW